MFDSYTMFVRYLIMAFAGYYGFTGEMTDIAIGLGLAAFTLVWKHAEVKGWIKGF